MFYRINTMCFQSDPEGLGMPKQKRCWERLA